jgi:hypothetical protein
MGMTKSQLDYLDELADAVRAGHDALAAMSTGECSPAVNNAGAEKPAKTVPVRMTRDQWREAKEFAARQDESLQELFIVGLNMLRASKGFPPLTGTQIDKRDGVE